jgi:excinuclease UvrABC nuclease subunit
MRWEVGDEKRAEVVEVQGWRSTDSVDQFQDRSGVYIFVSAGNDVKYIGKAGPRRMRDEMKDAISRGKNKDDGWVKALYTNSDEIAQKLETELIQKYNPPNNIT